MAGVVGLVLQEFDAQLVSYTSEQELAFGLESLSIPLAEMRTRVAECLRVLKLEHIRSCQPTSLSGGQRQLLALASVLILRLPVLVMDEVTSDLDPILQEELFTMISTFRRPGSTIVFSDHRTETAMYADEIWLINEGQLIRSAPPAEILGDCKLLRQCSVRPPATAELMQRLGYDSRLYSVKDAVRILQPTLSGPTIRPIEEDRGRGPSSSASLLQAKRLGYRYAAGSANVFEEIDLSIGEGEFVALIGRNGSGKTTLAKTLAGIYQPTQGGIWIEGRPLNGYRPNQRAEKVGYVFQNPDQQLFAATVSEEVAFGPIQLGYPPGTMETAVAEALASVGLIGYEQRDPVLMNKSVRQRISIASVLVTKPRILILDEPTKGLDYAAQTGFLAMLKQLHALGHTIVIITHSMWVVAEYCSRVVVMQEGRLVFDGPTRAAFEDAEVAHSRGIIPTDLVNLSNLLGLKEITLNGLESELRGRGGAASSGVE